jgi:two-component system, NarL family, response regulator LiaR
MNAMNKIRILIVDDHPVVREGLRVLISSEHSLDLVGEAFDGAEAVAKAGQCLPDVVLMDLIMPRMDGIQAIREIKKVAPNARILIMTSFAEDERILSAIKAGAMGYILKDAFPEELLKAIHDVARGEPSLSASVTLKIFRGLQEEEPESNRDEVELTERELEVLKLVAQGLSNQEIAAQLSFSEWTVRSRVSDILEKLHLANRTQAALYALRKKIVEL